MSHRNQPKTNERVVHDDGLGSITGHRTHEAYELLQSTRGATVALHCSAHEPGTRCTRRERKRQQRRAADAHLPDSWRAPSTVVAAIAAGVTYRLNYSLGVRSDAYSKHTRLMG